jgi:hypothetical protein
MQIRIETQHGTLRGEIDKKKNPKTAEKVIKSLPIEGKANLWGEEIYFKIPVKVEEENSQQEVEIGDIAYWPPGNALCIFFGKTPVSTSEKPKAFSPVNVIGKILENIEILKKVKDEEKIKILKE